MIGSGGATRFAHHPGPPTTSRILAVPAGALPIEATLPAGGRLLDALAALLQRSHVESAALSLIGGAFGPFAYVIPGLSPDGSQVAFYSDTRRPGGLTRLDVAAVTVGLRDGAPFFHCHALWTEADGRPGCGHVMPDETMIAAPIAVHGAGIVGARFVVQPDPETGFNLFKPQATGTPPPPNARPALALRLAPNQDLVGALEQAGHAAGFQRATLHGGVASINQARFQDAPAIAGFATELLVRHGAIRCSPGQDTPGCCSPGQDTPGCCSPGQDTPGEGPPTAVDITLVDHTGAIGSGRLVAGDNPVLMTFEGVLETCPPVEGSPRAKVVP